MATIETVKTCVQCGVELTGRRRKYCSDDCELNRSYLS